MLDHTNMLFFGSLVSRMAMFSANEKKKKKKK